VTWVSKFLAFASLTCAGSVALAQQGLIVEPWRQAPAPLASQGAATSRPMPASGLPANAAPAPRKPAPPLAALPGGHKWSPPVVELLVDPWAKVQIATPAMKLRWEPRSTEIVDPWADSRTEPPRIAARPSYVRPSTIF
jgi:hypothetical protein